MKFKVGDRVKVIKSNYCTGADKGLIGTVVGKYHGYAVEFDKAYIFTHSCSGVCPKRNGRFYGESELELISLEQKIVITTDGKETLARLYEGNKVIKSATAKCNPEDTFDFKVGAKIAFDRLVGEEKVIEAPKYFKGKAVCVKSNISSLIVGKIYDFSKNDGRGESDRGMKIVSIPCVSVDAINNRFNSSARFLEIKE